METEMVNKMIAITDRYYETRMSQQELADAITAIIEPVDDDERKLSSKAFHERTWSAVMTCVRYDHWGDWMGGDGIGMYAIEYEAAACRRGYA